MSRVFDAEDQHGALVTVGRIEPCVECVALQLSSKTFRVCSLCGRFVSPTSHRREPRKTRSYVTCR